MKWLLFESEPLSRVYALWKQAGERPFAILTAWEQQREPVDTTRSAHDAGRYMNKLDMEALGHDISSLGYGFSHAQGNYTGSDEPSYIVPGLSKEKALALGKKYKQDSILYVGPEYEEKAVLLFPKGGSPTVLGDFHAVNRGTDYTKVRHGKKFSFEAVERIVEQLLQEKE